MGVKTDLNRYRWNRAVFLACKKWGVAALVLLSIPAGAQSSASGNAATKLPVAVWMPLDGPSLDSLSISGKSLDKGAAMAWEFAAGFQWISDSLQFQTYWIDEFPEESFHVNGKSILGYAALASELNRLNIKMVIGPTKATASKKLASVWTGTVVNPLSRTVSGAPKNLWSATPSDADEAYSMGLWAASSCSSYAYASASSPSTGVSGGVGATAGVLEAAFRAGHAAAAGAVVPNANSDRAACRVLFDAQTASLLRTVSTLPAGNRLLLTSSAAESPSLEPKSFLLKSVFWSEIETWDYRSDSLYGLALGYARRWNAEPGRWSYHGMSVALWCAAQSQSGQWTVPVDIETPFKSFVWYRPTPDSGFANRGVRWVRP